MSKGAQLCSKLLGIKERGMSVKLEQNNPINECDIP